MVLTRSAALSSSLKLSAGLCEEKLIAVVGELDGKLAEVCEVF